MSGAEPGGPRYPQIRVRLASSNPLAVVAAVREALRLARVDRAEIRRFSEDALAAGGAASPEAAVAAAALDPSRIDRARLEAVCREWVGLAAAADDPGRAGGYS